MSSGGIDPVICKRRGRLRRLHVERDARRGQPKDHRAAREHRLAISLSNKEAHQPILRLTATCGPRKRVIESASQIPLLGKGGVRGGSIDLHAELFWNLTEPPLAPPLPRRGI